MYIQPGGGRYALVFVANSITEITAALRLQFSNKFNIAFLIDYGEDVRLGTYHHGKMVSDLNLLSYLSVEIEEHGTFTIDKNQQVTPDVSAELSKLLCESVELLEITIFVDWSKLEIPMLEEPLLMPGEATIFNDHYMDIKITPERIEAFEEAQYNPNKLMDLEVAYYGWNDLEEGEEIESEEYFAVPEEAVSTVVFL